MFKDENDFKKIIDNLNIDDKSKSEHKRCLRRQVLDAFEQGSQVTRWQDIRRKIMDTKQPNWDKQENLLIILVSPDGANKNASITTPLKVGQLAVGTIGGIDVTVQLKELVTATNAKATIIRIFDGQKDVDSIGDLSMYDSVFIRREDMKSLDVDVTIP